MIAPTKETQERTASEGGPYNGKRNPRTDPASDGRERSQAEEFRQFQRDQGQAWEARKSSQWRRIRGSGG